MCAAIDILAGQVNIASIDHLCLSLRGFKVNDHGFHSRTAVARDVTGLQPGY